MSERIAVIGLGYVGLPVALAFAARFPGTIGFDIDSKKIEALQDGIDRTGEVTRDALLETQLHYTCTPKDLTNTTFFVVAVPTPIDSNKRPDLSPLIQASETIGKVMRPGAVVVYESTVYPGVTEEICGPAIAKASGLRQGVDFKLGYSPERINPGDTEHTLARVMKIVAGEDAPTLERVASTYSEIVPAGLHQAPTIRVAEAAKVIENTQRDLNIALMNELALIFDRLGIRTRDVIAAAETKWNFVKFKPGLVGGHCIGVDPYYLTTKAEAVGYHPDVILAGRRVNDGMGPFLAQRMVKLLVHANIPVKCSRVGILGLTFKENVPDLRNSRVSDIVSELKEFGVQLLVHDPVADVNAAKEEYGIDLVSWDKMKDLDGIVLAVGHDFYQQLPREFWPQAIRPGGVLMDVKSILDPHSLPDTHVYWCL
ncbi:MAG: nucleotide sugar dehydrogenase [Chthonomonadaceae bacterium]|nr:nucleotide sugar dehydrogenase [Chthonomonadaceae bacterium]